MGGTHRELRRRVENSREGVGIREEKYKPVPTSISFFGNEPTLRGLL